MCDIFHPGHHCAGGLPKSHWVLTAKPESESAPQSSTYHVLMYIVLVIYCCVQTTPKTWWLKTTFLFCWAICLGSTWHPLGQLGFTVGIFQDGICIHMFGTPVPLGPHLCMA